MGLHPSKHKSANATTPLLEGSQNSLKNLASPINHPDEIRILNQPSDNEAQEVSTKLREILHSLRDKLNRLVFGNTEWSEEERRSIHEMRAEVNKLLQKHSWLAFLLNSFQSVVTTYIGTQFILPPANQQGKTRQYYINLGLGLITGISATLIILDGGLLWREKYLAKNAAGNHLASNRAIRNIDPRDIFRKLIDTGFNTTIIFSYIQVLGSLFKGKTGAYYEFFTHIAKQFDEMSIGTRAGILLGSIAGMASMVTALKYLSRHKKMSQKKTAQISHLVNLLISPMNATSVAALLLLIISDLSNENFGLTGISKGFVDYFPIVFPISQFLANIPFDHRESKSSRAMRVLSRGKRINHAFVMEAKFASFTALIAYNTISLFLNDNSPTFTNDDAMRILLSSAFTTAFLTSFVFNLSSLTREASPNVFYNVVSKSDIVGSFILTLAKTFYVAGVFSNGSVFAYADENFLIAIASTLTTSAGITWLRPARMVPFKKLDSLAYELALLRRVISNNNAYAPVAIVFSACDLALNALNAKFPQNYVLPYLIAAKHLLINGTGGYILASAFSSEYAWVGLVGATLLDFTITYLEKRYHTEPSQGKTLTASLARIFFNIASMLSMFLYDQPGNTVENYNLNRLWSVWFMMATFQLILISAMTNAITRELGSASENDIGNNHFETEEKQQTLEAGINAVLEENASEIEINHAEANTDLIANEKQIGLKPGYSARLFGPLEKRIDHVPEIIEKAAQNVSACVRNRLVPRPKVLSS